MPGIKKIVLIAVLVSAVMGYIQVVLAGNPEPTVACVEGAAGEPLLLSYGQHTVSCEINPGSDIDTFEFFASTGDVIRIAIRGNTTDLDPKIELFAPDFSLLLSALCTADRFNVCSRVVEETELPADGKYTIVVSDSGGTNPGSYTLDLEIIRPRFTPALLLFNEVLNDSIIQPLDVDYFRFRGVAGTRIRIALNGLTTNLDPGIKIIDPNGLVVLDEFCSADRFNICNRSDDLILAVTGEYEIQLREVGSDNTGNYRLFLQCILGNCACAERDFNADGAVNVTDLLQLLGGWGTCSLLCDPGCVGSPDTCIPDINRDCDVNVTDLLAMLASWGTCN